MTKRYVSGKKKKEKKNKGENIKTNTGTPSNHHHALFINDGLSTFITNPNDRFNKFLSSSLGHCQIVPPNSILPSSLPSRSTIFLCFVRISYIIVKMK